MNTVGTLETGCNLSTTTANALGLRKFISGARAWNSLPTALHSA